MKKTSDLHHKFLLQPLKILMTLLFSSVLCFSTSQAATGTLKHADYSVCFTPGGDCTNNIIATIAKAKTSIDVQAYSFTSAPIVKALLTEQKKGVKIFVLLDKSNVSSHYSVVTTLQNHHIPFLIDSKPAIAHNKIMIIDASHPHATVITGSFNFTKAAQTKNAENVLIVQSPELANIYLSNFNHRKALSKTYAQYCMSSTRCKMRSTAKDMGNSVNTAAEKSWDATKRAWHHVS